MQDLRKMTKDFLMEDFKNVNINTYIQSISDTLNLLRPRGQTESRRIEMAKQHIKEINRHVRRLQEQIQTLEEQINILEENEIEKEQENV